MSILNVEAYCEGLERLKRARELCELSPEDEELIEDSLTDLWKLLTVEECQEIERRYPELKIERI